MNRFIIYGLILITLLSIMTFLLIKKESFRNLISDEILKGNLSRTGVYYDIDN